MAMAVKLFEIKRLSSGMAATLAGLRRVNFFINLHRFNRDVPEDLNFVWRLRVKSRQKLRLVLFSLAA